MGPANSDFPGESKPRRRPGRAPTSCAECRRLKLRCDRNVPCQKCVSRGCAQICPSGLLTSGKGNRMILANTEELHEKNDILRSRVRELEDALRTLQASAAPEQPHPLLRDELLQLKVPMTGQGDAQPRTGSVATKIEDDDITDAFGTLSIGMHGEASFLGKTARSEYLIRALEKPQRVSNLVFPRLSKKIIEATCPETEIEVDVDLGREVYGLLPSLSEAIHLCEVYIEYGRTVYAAIPRSELFDDVLSVVYRAECFDSCHSYHALSMMFMVFALATLFDVTKPPYSIEAQEYYLLARVSLSFCPPVLQTTLFAIQTLIHMTQYLDLSDWESLGSGVAWTYIGLGVRLGHSIGLHLNSARWMLGEDASQKRSRVFWQLFLLDTWMSFGFGRPPIMLSPFIDCALPKDPEEFVNDDSQREMGFHLWTWQYTKLMHSVMTTAFGVKMPPYSTILDLDRKIRDFPVPPHLRPKCEDYENCPPLHMQRWLVLAYKESALLNLHRCYFARALQDQPNDLLKHKYAPSVMATYRSAWRLIQSLTRSMDHTSHTLQRHNLSWSQGISAAIVMCLLVTRAPASNLATSSLAELDRVAHTFAEAAANCKAASNNLGSIQKLCRKAHAAMDQSQSHEPTLTPTELDRLGGKTHLISSTPGCTPPADTFSPTPASGSSSTMPSMPPMPGAEQFACTPRGPDAAENIHPTIMQDMKTFEDLGMQYIPNFNHIFDFPPASLPQDMPDIQFPDSDLFARAPFHPQPLGNFQMAPPTAAAVAAGFNPGPPVLDATWQSFVEQLGF